MIQGQIKPIEEYLIHHSWNWATNSDAREVMAQSAKLITRRDAKYTEKIHNRLHEHARGKLMNMVLMVWDLTDAVWGSKSGIVPWHHAFYEVPIAPERLVLQG